MTFDVLHHHVYGAISCSPQIINRNGVGVTKATSCLSFWPKPAKPLSIGSNFRWENLYSDAIAEAYVTSPVNSAHSPFSKEGFHLVLAIQNGIDYLGRIVFQHFPINGAEAYAIVVFCLAGAAVFHSGLSTQTVKAVAPGTRLT